MKTEYNTEHSYVYGISASPINILVLAVSWITVL